MISSSNGTTSLHMGVVDANIGVEQGVEVVVVIGDEDSDDDDDENNVNRS